MANGKSDLVDFKPGSTEQVTLSFDQPKTGTTRGRQWIRYGVQHQGQNKGFFATPQGHAAIQELGARKGDTLVIHVDSDGEWHVGFNQDDLDVPEAVFDTKPITPGPNARPAAPTFQDLLEKYEVCLSEALDLARRTLPNEITNEDVRSIATTLYIQAERAGVSFPKNDATEG